MALDVIPSALVSAARRARQSIDRSEVEIVWLTRAFHAGWIGLALLAAGVMALIRGKRRSQSNASALAIVIICLCTAHMAADDWPAPVPQSVFSNNGRYFVRIIPGTDVGGAVGFAGAPRGPNARGEFYERQPNRSYRLIGDVLLQNPVSPIDALVTNAGYVVTFDNWHNFGYGLVVVIYAPGGRLIRAFTAEQLYSRDQLAKIPLSESLRWWRYAPHGYVDPDEQTTIYVSEHFGGSFTFTLRDGAFTYQPGKAECRPPRGPFSASWFGR